MFKYRSLWGPLYIRTMNKGFTACVCLELLSVSSSMERCAESTVPRVSTQHDGPSVNLISSRLLRLTPFPVGRPPAVTVPFPVGSPAHCSCTTSCERPAHSGCITSWARILDQYKGENEYIWCFMFLHCGCHVTRCWELLLS